MPSEEGGSIWWEVRLVAINGLFIIFKYFGLLWWLRQERLNFWKIKCKGGRRKGEEKYEMCDTLQWCSYLGSSWMTQQIPDTTVLILWAVIQTPHVQPTQIRGSIISNCHRQAKSVKNNLTSMEGRTGARSSFGRFVLFVFCSMMCETAWTWIWGSVQIHLSYPVVFNHGAKGLLSVRERNLHWQKQLCKLEGNNYKRVLYQ